MSTPPLDLRSGVDGSVAAQIRTLGDHQVVAIEIDPAERRGALAEADGRTFFTAGRAAVEQRIPLVGMIASSGADISAGLGALHGWGMAAHALAQCSGAVPVLLAVTGPAVSGPALLLGLADQVVMTSDAYAFVSGPLMVREFTGQAMTNRDLGGAGVHARSSGVASLVVRDTDAAWDALADLLSFLPPSTDDLPPRQPTDDPIDRRVPEAGELMPDSPTGSYDVRTVLRILVDDHELLELRSQWAPNIVTALASFGGYSVGLVANQPVDRAGTVDIAASQKAARFVAFCDAFNLPIVTLVDTPGFFPGKDLEWRGMIRKGAQLAFAYARATVPRICVTLRKSYGGAYIVMDSRYMGNDLAFAWPSAEIAVMGAAAAVGIIHRGEPDREALERDYAERLLNPYVAASRGSVDAVIDPADTRRLICQGVDLLADKRERLALRRHDNHPL